jgi:hypothetical protein
MNALLAFLLALISWAPFLPAPDPLWKDKNAPRVKSPAVLPGTDPRAWKGGMQGQWLERRKITVTKVMPGWIEARVTLCPDVYYLYPTAGWQAGMRFPNKAVLRIDEIREAMLGNPPAPAFQVRARIISLPVGK